LDPPRGVSFLPGGHRSRSHSWDKCGENHLSADRKKSRRSGATTRASNLLHGVIRADVDPIAIARVQGAGAACQSVPTDVAFFLAAIAI
jgi:hypothetical protein